MRILIVSNSYLPEVGGVEVAVHHLGQELRRKGHGVAIFTSRPGSLRLRHWIDTVEVHRLAWSPRPALTLPLRGAAALGALGRFIASWKPDVVYAHFISTNAFYALALQPLLRFPFIVSARGNDVQGMPARSRLHRLLLGLCLRRADEVLFCSTALQQAAGPLLHAAGRRGMVMGDGVDLSEFDAVAAAEQAQPYLLAMGRMVEKKGFDLLLRAFPAVRRANPEISLVIAGDGPQRPALEALAAELGIADVVRFTGFVDRKRAVGLLKGCHFFVLPSREEPFGIVNVEAMAAGKAVLATAVGGVPGIVRNGLTGRLVEPTAEALSTGMLELLTLPGRCVQYGAEGRKVVARDYTWGRVADVLLAICSEILTRRQRPSLCAAEGSR